MTANAFDVVPVIEQGLDGLRDTHNVQVALTPDARLRVLRGISRAVLVASMRHKPVLAKLYASGSVQIDGDQHSALASLDTLLGDDWATWLIDPDEATAFGGALFEAAETPPSCSDCHRLIDSDMQGSSCARCTDTPRGRRAS